MKEILLEVKGLSKTFDSKGIPALRDISFSINRGQRVSLLGPSGTGKSTLLSILAGEKEADSGEVERKASIGLLKGLDPKDYSLTLREYIKADLKTGDELEDENRMREMIEFFNLFYKEDNLMCELSLGRQRRACFARALAPRPQVILMDEPFSNLDDYLKREIREEIFTYLDGMDVATLFVTHDLAEALSFSDYCLFLDDGNVKQEGKPEELYDFPRDGHVARFFGPCNLYSSPWDGSGKVKTEIGEFEVSKKSSWIKEGAAHVYMMVRANEWIEDKNGVSLTIKKKSFQGECYEYTLEQGFKNSIIYRSAVSYIIGQQLTILPDLSKVRLIPV